MGKGIKTRVSEKKGIKAIDKAAVASERMKEAYIRTKDKADHSLYAEESSPGEYASDRLSAGVDNVTHEAVHQFDKQGRKGVQTTKENTPTLAARSSTVISAFMRAFLMISPSVSCLLCTYSSPLFLFYRFMPDL